MFSAPGSGWKSYGAQFKVQHHQAIKRGRVPRKGAPGNKLLRRTYHANWVQYGFGGFGMVHYQPAADSSFKQLNLSGHYPQRFNLEDPSTSTAKSLSPQWRSFGLADGGVLFCHPDRKQVLQWNEKTLEKENAAMGFGGLDQMAKTKIQRLIADNSLEYVPLSSWRRAQLWRLIRTHGNGPETQSVPGITKDP